MRLTPARNNQRLGIRYAADYEIDRWTFEKLAALAQIGVSTLAERSLAA